MRNIKLTLEYEGTNYHGWQIQPKDPTIQAEVEKAVYKLTGEHCPVYGSSRTDMGVHALGYVCNFKTESGIPADKFSFALNTILPEDIAVKNSSEVDITFHSRHSAKGKKYRYIIYNDVFPSPLLRNRAFFIPKKLKTDLMQKAAEYYIGCHDFSAFMAAGGNIRSTEKNIYESIVSKSENKIIFEIKGDGFLYNMVRIMAGTLVEVGLERMDPQDIPQIIKSKDRKKAGRTAPPHGLYLVEVYY